MSRVTRASRLGLPRRVGVVCALLVVLGGCATARSDLGTTSGACFLALPSATAAVHSHGRLVGARLLTVSALRHDTDLKAVLDSSTQPKDSRVCLIGFVGSFDANQVSHPFGDRSGRAAVVVVGYPDDRLLGTVLFGHLPPRFTHPHLGIG